jgi:hypothetical protein
VTGDNTAASITGQGSLATLSSVDWNSTLDNIPDRVSDTATTGLNLTDTHIGYYDGTDFKTYIQSNGDFRFGGAGDNYIEFDGTSLTLGSEVTIGDNTDRTVTVGSGGDFSTLNLALESLSRTVPAYKSGGFEAKIQLLSGYIETERIRVSNIDLSWIRIVAQGDATISIEPAASMIDWLTVDGGGSSPIIDASFSLVYAISTNHLMAANNGSKLILGNGRTFDGGGNANTIVTVTGGSSLLTESNCTFQGTGGINTTILVNGLSSADLDFCTIKDGGISALLSSTVSANFTTINSTATLRPAIFATLSSRIGVSNGTITAPSGIDIAGVEKGGIISLDGVTGSTSQTRDTLTSDGIIFS